MPAFNLRIWAEQTLFDSSDYVVTADTLEDAVTLLQDQQELVDYGYEPGPPKHPDISGTMKELDPKVVVEVEGGVTLLDDDGKRVRDLIGVPDGCPKLGEELFPSPPTEAAPTPLYTLQISHRYGDSFWVFDSSDKAHVRLAAWAREWWSTDGPRDPITNESLDMPEEDAEVVEEYFGEAGKEEYWSIGEAYLNQG